MFALQTVQFSKDTVALLMEQEVPAASILQGAVIASDKAWLMMKQQVSSMAAANPDHLARACGHLPGQLASQKSDVASLKLVLDTRGCFSGLSISSLERKFMSLRSCS